MALFRNKARIAALEAQVAQVAKVEAEARSTYALGLYSSEFRRAMSGSGVYVDEDTALQHDAVWSCVTRIAQDVSMMPVDVVRYLPDGSRVEVDAPQIIANPSAVVPALDWRYQVVASWLTAGNAWGRVTATTANMGHPTRIELLSPGQVRPDGNGGFLVDGKSATLWPAGDLWHWPAYTAPGSVWGMSPISYHARSIGIGLSAEKFGSDFFEDGGHPSAILSPEAMPTPEQASALKRRFVEVTRGNREPIVLPQSTTYTPIQVNPEDSQFLNAMRYSAEQIIRVFGEDPADYGLSMQGTSVTYANRSDADLARFKRRQFWVVKLQDALTSMIPRPQYARLNTSAALMMTTRERHELYKLRLDSDTITVNEIRRIEDESPFDGPVFDLPGLPEPAAMPAQGVTS